MNIQFRTVVAGPTDILALTTTRVVSSGGFFNKRARESSLAKANHFSHRKSNHQSYRSAN
jgi:hypothetical protein